LARDALAPFDRTAGEGPYAVQRDLQEMMQDLVGIVRQEDEMRQALRGLEDLARRAGAVSVNGNREYNPGWHAALDLANLLLVSEAVTRSALERRESRGAHFRLDYPAPDPAAAGFNVVVRKDREGRMAVERAPRPPIRPDLQALIEENK
jgi:succinate dehydrogenase / fumarate reductase flavoprotein subunit